ncbi:hypothetical protein VRU48_14900 [Pedobacter sp. KR3-3]|uniref:DUF177 domain-containing protein n=1 Tax=Pedobacter albus TaxID=3113905 RepID=A0ABU7IAA7_9SPHI|nr:hypothetical protein [Pedobacter sp. KR3-3]MEE1946410.1 hypothetical protein [Pedobacter sp. KR3-3]
MMRSAEELLRRRLSGILPEIDIAGNRFEVDWPGRKLIQCTDRRVEIRLDTLLLTRDAKHYQCCFDLVNKKVVRLSENITRLPENIVRLLIPYELTLDPVAVAREMNQPVAELLKVFPIREGLKAEVIPLEQTEWAQKVRANREKKQTGRWFKSWRGNKKGL